MAGRSIRVTDDMMKDAKRLVKLLGVPMVEAPCEAEAQCAELCKMGLAFGTATEDMDALTFGTNFLMRGFNSKKEPICQIELARVLADFEMTQAEFIDLCILCGCDYTHSIGGMGPVTAFKLIKEHGSIEPIMEKVVNVVNADPEKKKKFIVPDNFLYKESRELFVTPDVNRDKEALQKAIVWDKPYEEELKEWLTKEKGFAENKVESGLERLKKCQTKKNQIRLDSFFKAGPTLSSTKKVEAPKKGAAGKKSSFAQAKRKSTV